MDTGFGFCTCDKGCRYFFFFGNNAANLLLFQKPKRACIAGTSWIEGAGKICVAQPTTNSSQHHTVWRQHFSCQWYYVKPWLWIQNLCSPLLWEAVLHLMPCPLLPAYLKSAKPWNESHIISGRTEYFTAGGRKWDLPSRDCLQCILLGAAIGGSHTVQNTLEQTIIYLSTTLLRIFLFFAGSPELRQKRNSKLCVIQRALQFFLYFCYCCFLFFFLHWLLRQPQCTVSNQRPIK